ncbi:hypothetical protein AQJ30_23775 [Streptomyces longwoodensis]|uniref:Uncharacterized protein n=1 Tax=Streptomyces longwoodensis TaxID=68231 RepID=A0A117QM03_9ACTN|nr:hypothetical protein AQJ30_23775 [Streptomyces longwoodensis]
MSQNAAAGRLFEIVLAATHHVCQQIMDIHQRLPGWRHNSFQCSNGFQGSFNDRVGQLSVRLGFFGVARARSSSEHRFGAAEGEYGCSPGRRVLRGIRTGVHRPQHPLYQLPLMAR